MQTVFESVTAGVEIIHNILCIFSMFSKISDFVVQMIVITWRMSFKCKRRWPL